MTDPSEPLEALRQVKRLQAADETALAWLYDQYGRLMFSLALRILTNPDDAEDVVADVFRELWSNPARFDPARGSVKGYLVLLTRSRAIDRLRTARARNRHTERLQALTPTQTAQDPGDHTVHSEQVQKLREALAELQPQQREMIDAAFFRGMTHAQIAEQLQRPLGTVKTLIRQGLRHLRDALGGDETVDRTVRS